MKDNPTLLDNFKLYFPNVYSKATYCFQSGPFEATANLEDDTVVIYNDLRKTIRYESDKDYEHPDENDWLANFGSNLNKIISKRGGNQTWLSKATGIQQPTISRIISGKRSASNYEIRLIADALDCTVSELFGF